MFIWKMSHPHRAFKNHSEAWWWWGGFRVLIVGLIVRREEFSCLKSELILRSLTQSEDPLPSLNHRALKCRRSRATMTFKSHH